MTYIISVVCVCSVESKLIHHPSNSSNAFLGDKFETSLRPNVDCVLKSIRKNLGIVLRFQVPHGVALSILSTSYPFLGLLNRIERSENRVTKLERICDRER